MPEYSRKRVVWRQLYAYLEIKITKGQSGARFRSIISRETPQNPQHKIHHTHYHHRPRFEASGVDDRRRRPYFCCRGFYFSSGSNSRAGRISWSTRHTRDLFDFLKNREPFVRERRATFHRVVVRHCRPSRSNGARGRVRAARYTPLAGLLVL